MDYGTLQTRVKRRVIDLPAAVTTEVPDLINEAIRELEDLHNFFEMRTTITSSTTVGQRLLIVTPSLYKGFRGRPYWISDLGVVTEMTVAPNENAALRRYGDDSVTNRGSPQAVLETAGGTKQISIYPYPDNLSDYTNGDYRVTVPTWNYLADLVNDGDTNWFTDNAPMWIINQATSEAFALNWDEGRSTYWENKAAKRFAQVMKLDKNRHLSGVTTFVTHRGARSPMMRNL